MANQTTSRTIATYTRLRNDILAGRTSPESKLKIQDLAVKYGVSPSVIREALSKLSSESLVIAEPQRGFRVAPIKVEDIKDLTEVRIDIEAKCLRRAISRGDMSWETGIVAAQHQLRNTPFDRDNITDEWREAHSGYHSALVAACDSAWLLNMREQLFIQGERFRSVIMWDHGAERPIRHEHDELVQAVLDRDVKNAVKLMTEHLRMTEMVTLGALEHRDVTGPCGRTVRADEVRRKAGPSTAACEPVRQS